MKQYFRLLILFSFFLLSFSNSKAENIKLSGKVIDSDNLPVEMVTIKLAGSSYGTTTDKKGYFSFSVPERDSLVVTFTCIGFKSVKYKLQSPHGNITLNVKLHPIDFDLSEHEVIGFKKNRNGMQTFNIDSYKISPDVNGGSIEALLSTMPGVYSSNELSSAYSVRGGSFDENSVYINGTEVYRPQLIKSGEQEGLSIINPSMVKNLSFSSGGFLARYDDKMSSVLDIMYRQPKEFELSTDLSLLGCLLTIGTSSKSYSQLHSIRYKRNNSLISTLDTKGEYDPIFFDYQTNINFKLASNTSLNILGNINNSNYIFRPSDRETSFGTLTDAKRFKVFFDGEERDHFATYLLSASLIRKLNNKTSFSLGLSGFYTKENVTYDISSEYWLHHNVSGNINNSIGIGKYMEHMRNRLNATVIHFYFKGESATKLGRFNYGTGYKKEYFRDRTKEWEWRDSAGYSLPTIPEGVNLIYHLKSAQSLSTSRLYAYIEDAMSFETENTYMSLNAGLRASWWNFNQETLFSPRLTFSISPIQNTNIIYRLSTGIFYQSPFYKEYRVKKTINPGNETISLNNKINSPRNIQLTAGTDYIFKFLNRHFKLSSELYFKKLSNLISYEFDNLKVIYSGLNDSKGYVAGLDFKLFGQFVEGTDSWISASFMKTQQNLRGIKVPLPSDQRYSFSIYFTDYFPRFPKLRFSLRGILSDGLTRTSPHITRDCSYFRSPPYKRLDAGITYQIIGSQREGVIPYNIWRHINDFSIGIDCFNLFDITNVSNYYWITDINNVQYAVPNYLTRRQLNLRISMSI